MDETYMKNSHWPEGQFTLVFQRWYMAPYDSLHCPALIEITWEHEELSFHLDPSLLHSAPRARRQRGSASGSTPTQTEEWVPRPCWGSSPSVLFFSFTISAAFSSPYPDGATGLSAVHRRQLQDRFERYSYTLSLRLCCSYSSSSSLSRTHLRLGAWRLGILPIFALFPNFVFGFI